MENLIEQQFDELGIEVTSDILEKSSRLCELYKIDAVQFVEKWIAFTISNLNGAEPTIDGLLEFEKKVFQTNKENKLRINKIIKDSKAELNNSKYTNNESISNKHVTIYGKEPELIEVNAESEPYDNGNDYDLLSSYSSQHTPKAKSELTRKAYKNGAVFSPASYSPTVGTPRSQLSSQHSGKIVYTFGNQAIINSTKWCSSNQTKVCVKQLLVHEGEALGAKKFRYFHDNLFEKSLILGDNFDKISKGLWKKVFAENKPEDYDVIEVDAYSQITAKAVGTIICEHEGPLDDCSIMLLGKNSTIPKTVYLDISKAKSLSVFPGQIVIASGIKPRGNTFIVHEILAERPLATTPLPKNFEELVFVIASGPYTHEDDLTFEPLNNLLAYLEENKPDVLILMGPFVEATHKLIGCNITIAEALDAFFEKIISGIVDVVGQTTKILIVASYQDVNSSGVYPTMPYSLKKSYPNVQMLADPSIIDLNGLTIGVTSTDILDHILQNEYAHNADEKIKRVVNYLFNQGSFYPLHPPVEEMCYDSSIAEHYAVMDSIPNVLILPSKQKCFIRIVNGCLIINPGRLIEKDSSGTFGRFVMSSPEAKDETKIYNYVGCQIRKI